MPEDLEAIAQRLFTQKLLKLAERWDLTGDDYAEFRKVAFASRGVPLPEAAREPLVQVAKLAKREVPTGTKVEVSPPRGKKPDEEALRAKLDEYLRLYGEEEGIRRAMMDGAVGVGAMARLTGRPKSTLSAIKNKSGAPRVSEPMRNVLVAVVVLDEMGERATVPLVVKVLAKAGLMGAYSEQTSVAQAFRNLARQNFVEVALEDPPYASPKPEGVAWVAEREPALAASVRNVLAEHGWRV